MSEQSHPENAMSKKSPEKRQTISLVKGKHTFSFRYAAGEEKGVLDALAAMVKRRDLSFDWFDAAVLSHQLGQHLSQELQSFLPKKAA